MISAENGAFFRQLFRQNHEHTFQEQNEPQ